jgi:hypothetical protein
MKAFLISALLGATVATAAHGTQTSTAAYDTKPWLEDLVQLRDALSGHYAHLEWAVEERGANLPQLWSMAEGQLKNAKSDAEARQTFDKFLEYFGDGHLRMDWSQSGPQPQASSTPATEGAANCAAMGFRQRKDNGAVALQAPGYQPLGNADDVLFPAGIIDHSGKKIGVLRIQLFSYDIHPSLCEDAVKALSSQGKQPAEDQVRGLVDQLFHAAFVRQVKALSAARPDLLLVDIAGNGGGTEWAEAAMRVLTPIPLRSLDFGMVRHPHWLKQLDDRDRELAVYETKAKGNDKAVLRDLRLKIAKARAEVATPCDMLPLWKGEKPACPMLVSGVGTAGGLLGSGSVKEVWKLSWGSSLLHAAAYDFEEGAWSGPLIILVDQKTASASVQFAGTLQGNKAAIVMGAPTMASGCGFTWGGIETRLKNSGARVHIPDCARLRPDGSDDNGGVDPDVLVGFKTPEAAPRRVQHFLRRLPEAVQAAEALARQRP